MARTDAHIPVEIWTWPEFLALEEGPQLRYLFLWTQPDLDHTGVISLRERRWAKKSKDLKAKQVAAELEALAEAGLVLVDEDHEELLLCRFMRLDKVYKQPNILRAAFKQLASVASSLIRSALGREVAELYALEDTPDGSLLPLEDMRHALEDAAEMGSSVAAAVAVEGMGEPFREGSEEGFSEPLGDGGAEGSEKEKEKEKGVGGAGEGGSRRTTRGTRLPEPFEPTEDMIAWAREKAPQVGASEHEKFCDYWRAQPGQKGVKVDWPATWRNWMRRAQEDRGRPGSAVAVRRGNDLDQKHQMLARARARAAEMDALEGRE